MAEGTGRSGQGRQPAPSVSKNETRQSCRRRHYPKTGQPVAGGGRSGAGEGRSVRKPTPSGSREGQSIRRLARSGDKPGQSGAWGGQPVPKAGQSCCRMGHPETPRAPQPGPARYFCRTEPDSSRLRSFGNRSSRFDKEAAPAALLPGVSAGDNPGTRAGGGSNTTENSMASTAHVPPP